MNEDIENENAISNEFNGDSETDVSDSDDLSVYDTTIPTEIPTPYATSSPILEDSQTDSIEVDSEVIVEGELVNSEIDSATEMVQSNDDILRSVQSIDSSLQRTNYLLSAILFFVIFWWIEEKIFKSVRRLFVNAGDH